MLEWRCFRPLFDLMGSGAQFLYTGLMVSDGRDIVDTCTHAFGLTEQVCTIELGIPSIRERDVGNKLTQWPIRS